MKAIVAVKTTAADQKLVVMGDREGAFLSWRSESVRVAPACSSVAHRSDYGQPRVRVFWSQNFFFKKKENAVKNNEK